MEKETYDMKISAIQSKAESEKKIVLKEYVESNNPYNHGDIIEDHYHIIKIVKISYGISSDGYPCAVYSGIQLNKDLSPSKRQSKTTMWQSNVLDHIK